MFKVIVSPRAWDDFFAIFEYIAEDNEDVARRFCGALLDHIELLAAFPHIGSRSRESRGVRSILHTPVRIYYRVDEQRQGVEVIHFWHTSRQNPEKI